MPSLRIKVESATLLYDKKRLRQVLRVAGAEVAATARSLIKQSARGGRTYSGSGGSSGYRGGYRKGLFTASVAGAPPASVTGTLARSIKVLPFKSGEGVAVRDSAFYALFLEAGAQGGGGKRGAKNVYRKRGGKRSRVSVNGVRVLEARPFLNAALNSRAPSLLPRIEASIRDDIKMVRVKA